MKLRILLADDHEIVRRGLRALLEKREGWEVCGEASDGREAVEKALQLKPDVVIVDIGMPNLNGLDTTRQLLQHDPHFKVIVLTITDSDQVIREALDAGARGFVLKSDAARDLVSAVEALQNKRMFFTPRVNDLVLAGFLEEGPYLAGDAFSLADILAGCHLELLSRAPEAEAMMRGTALQGWLDRVCARPSFVSTTWEQLEAKAA